MQPDELLQSVVPAALVVIGIMAIAVSIYGFVLADPPTKAEYESAISSCGESERLNQSEEEACRNVTYQEFKEFSEHSFLGTPFTPAVALVWGGFGVVFTSLGVFKGVL